MKTTISFEFFPPKSKDAEEELWSEMRILAHLGPKYMTVTYGAGGSTKDGTLQTLKNAIHDFQIPMASHLTYLSTTKDDLDAYTDELWDAGVKRLIALRGDLPKGARYEDFTGDEYHKFTSEFVEHILRRKPFDTTVGAYPEKHPDAPSMDADIEALRKKCDAGAAQAITQFFFDNRTYYDFVEKCVKAGITTPIYPGLLPIHDFGGVCRFAAKCGANIPDWLHAEFLGFEHKPEEAEKIATEILIEQVEDLAKNGVKHLHFYTLNKSEITRQACEALI